MGQKRLKYNPKLELVQDYSELNIRAKNGGFEVQKRVRGKARSKAVKTIEEARFWRDPWDLEKKYPALYESTIGLTLMDKSAGSVVFTRLPENKPVELTISDLIDQFIKSPPPKFNLDSGIRNYLKTWKKKIGKVTLRDLRDGKNDSSLRMNKAFEAIQREYTSNATPNRYRAVLSKVFTYASTGRMGSKYNELVPFSKINKILEKLDEAETRNYTYAVSEGRIRQVVKYTEELPDYKRIFVLLQIITGRRFKELSSITVADYDHGKKLITIPRSRTKTKKRDTVIPISGGGLRKVIREGLVSLSEGKKEDDYIFTDENGKWLYLKKDPVIRALKRDCNVTTKIFRKTVQEQIVKEYNSYELASQYVGLQSQTVSGEHYAPITLDKIM